MLIPIHSCFIYFFQLYSKTLNLVFQFSIWHEQKRHCLNKVISLKITIYLSFYSQLSNIANAKIHNFILLLANCAAKFTITKLKIKIQLKSATNSNITKVWGKNKRDHNKHQMCQFSNEQHCGNTQHNNSVLTAFCKKCQNWYQFDFWRGGGLFQKVGATTEKQDG